jgi:Glycosyl hydrolases family 16
MMLGVAQPSAARLIFEDDFDGPELDRNFWFPHYLPAWSSRAATAATYEISDSCLTLLIPLEQGHWLPGEHMPPLRVSGIQSGNFSGPVGSNIGQQPWRTGAMVREEQQPFWGWTPDHGCLEMRARGFITERSMFAWWMVGLEDVPDRCAEICVAEIFGAAVEPGTSAAVGMGLHPFRDPRVVEDFAAVRLPIDVAEFHSYAVNWTSERVDFFVDCNLVRSCPNPPTYPMQMMLAVFDSPDRSTSADSDAVPRFDIDYIRGFETSGPAEPVKAAGG